MEGYNKHYQHSRTRPASVSPMHVVDISLDPQTPVENQYRAIFKLDMICSLYSFIYKDTLGLG